MKTMPKLLVRLLSLCLSFMLLASVAVSAYGDSNNKRMVFGLQADKNTEVAKESKEDEEAEEETPRLSRKERIDACTEKYMDYQEDTKDEDSVDTTMPDSFSLVRTIDGEIRQVQVFSPEYSKGKAPENSCYSPLEGYSIIYYYEDGLPYFALCYDDNTKPREQFRFYLSQGEIVQWVDERGMKSYNPPEEFFFIYDHALSAYSRATYDRYDTGDYAVQVGSFKEREQAEKCRDSLIEAGEDARMEKIDGVYCVLIGEYEDWEEAAEAFQDMELTEECGTTYVRLI